MFKKFKIFIFNEQKLTLYVPRSSNDAIKSTTADTTVKTIYLKKKNIIQEIIDIFFVTYAIQCVFYLHSQMHLQSLLIQL